MVAAGAVVREGSLFFSCSFSFPSASPFAFSTSPRLVLDSVPPADSTHLHASHTTLSGPNELIWSNRGSFPACRLRKVPRMLFILGRSDPRLSYQDAGLDGAVETSPTRVTQIERDADSAIYVEDALPFVFPPPVGHLHDVRRIDNRRNSRLMYLGRS